MSNRNWRNNAIQFPRLIAELEAAGAFTPEVYRDLCVSMDLLPQEISDLIERAVREWDRIKSNT
jgi:hypothetical protein